MGIPAAPVSSIPELLARQFRNYSDRPALASPGTRPLTYTELFRRVSVLVELLRREGAPDARRVALVLDDGLEMALAALAAMCFGEAAPLAPASTKAEFRTHLEDLSAGVLVTRGTRSPAGAVAGELGIRIVDLDEVEIDVKMAADDLPDRDPGDVALVLHTSGSTSGPKRVPLSHRNLSASARNIAASLRLGPDDRCLNVMPLFHIHGLVGGILSSLSAGGSVICAHGFEESEFFESLLHDRPTWYTAVPTIHASVASGIERTRANVESHLRFVRSSSSALSPSLMTRLEQVLNAPVVEAYGMTEAAHQIAVNPLPPGVRKPGSVGRPAGTEVQVVDENWTPAPSGAVGEIVIRGPGVTRGYEGAAEQNARLFRDGWLRTGDEGRFDEDGYLFITGRIKELINRGGEKVTPREVDEVFLEHAAVAQAVTFGVPHPTLGQDVVAAVVTRPDGSVTETELRERAFERLAPWKVPSRIVFVSEIPRTPTGKLRRVDLHSALKPALITEHAAPESADERSLVALWQKVLGRDRVGIDDNFFDLGGDSLAAVRLVSQIKRQLDRDVDPTAVFRAPTIRQFAARYLKEGESTSSRDGSLVALSPHSFEMPLFCIPGTMGNVSRDLGALARYLAPAVGVFAFQDRMGNPLDPGAMAEKYVGELMRSGHHPPFRLLGVCSGAVVALEMARRLRSAEQDVAFVAMVEPPVMPPNIVAAAGEFVGLLARRLFSGRRRHSSAISNLSGAERANYLRVRLRFYGIHWAVRRYRPESDSVRVFLYRTRGTESAERSRRELWPTVSSDATSRTIEGTRESIIGKDRPVDDGIMKALALRVLADLR